MTEFRSRRQSLQQRDSEQRALGKARVCLECVGRGLRGTRYHGTAGEGLKQANPAQASQFGPDNPRTARNSNVRCVWENKGTQGNVVYIGLHAATAGAAVAQQAVNCMHMRLARRCLPVYCAVISIYKSQQPKFWSSNQPALKHQIEPHSFYLNTLSTKTNSNNGLSRCRRPP